MGLAAVLAAGIFALARWEDAPVAFLLRPFGVCRRSPRSGSTTSRETSSLGFAAVRRVGIALPALALSFVAVLVIAFSFWLVAFAMHLDLGFGAAILVMVAVNFAMVIPGTPGALGVFEAATVVALHPFGVDRADALSYGIVLHALNSLPFIAIGFVLLHRHGVRALRGTSSASVEPLRPSQDGSAWTRIAPSPLRVRLLAVLRRRRGPCPRRAR